MFGHDESHHGQIMNVSTFFDLSLHVFSITMTGFTLVGTMDDDLIRCLHSLQTVSDMTSVPPCRFLALRTALLVPFEAIT